MFYQIKQSISSNYFYVISLFLNNIILQNVLFMMMSSNGNILFLVLLCERNHRSSVDSLTKASDSELWYFLWSAPGQTVEQTIETPVMWHAIALIKMSLKCQTEHFNPSEACTCHIRYVRQVKWATYAANIIWLSGPGSVAWQYYWSNFWWCLCKKKKSSMNFRMTRMECEFKE